MSLTGSTNAEKIWNYLYKQLNNAYGVAGLMGNLYAESGLNPKNLQNSYETKLGYTDDTYTDAVDDGSYTNFIKDSAGYGLAQWTYWSRKQNMYNYIITKLGNSIGDLESQLAFLIYELTNSYSTVLSSLKSATSIQDASDIVLTKFENPADQSSSVKTKRATYGQKYYDLYAEASSSSSSSKTSVTYPSVPFTVKVIVDDLNIRNSASMSGTIKGVTGKGTFTITEVSNDWGKLKSGKGWIYLANSSYVTINSSTSTSTSTFESYQVKVIASALNIRSGPKISYSKTGVIKDKGVYTIVDESDNWGKLKSGVGWINLAYTTKI